MATRVVWFRRDLRLNDHTALAKALEHTEKDDQILLMFHIHPALNKEFTVRHDYFFQTLKSLVDQAHGLGAPIHFLDGDLKEALQTLKSKVEAESVYFNIDETGFGWKRDQEILAYLEEELNVKTFTYQDHHLHGADEVTKKDGGYYKVFTPYYKSWKDLQKPAVQKVDHELLKKAAVNDTENFDSKAYENLISKIDRSFEGVGEKDAMDRLEQFLDSAIYDYDKERDFPAVDGTSLMSRYLRTGAISIRTVYHRIHDQVNFRKNTEGVETYISELAWRDFYNMIYHFYPNASDKEMVEKYQGLDWNDDEELFEQWKEGRTGFPIIDAAIRQLNESGWMHNRLRMAVASFLTKDLLMDWRKGERYFAERLVDYDPASNIGGWQWAASTGTDPVPYFRVFNPTRQSERFDPHGRFIKEWIPELENVKKKYIHEPSKMPESEQEKADCIIGEDYPEPMVDHKTMRERAIEMFKKEK
ncbi:deoxyribodipyrimidine photo-lyase [Halobacillus sp. BBL2006]|uniref:cryptochrome/photolyase family protein n=1 Tax=Halobacillus sp. BBL2006 TaxID=1543706 RepID=UPI0005421BBC|nr:deoxyribodipyrimidine photo-lyase [Halobacillus sp. BBL2006]KHE67358.1 deoxyribodipyrimidine photolyase [Halobacillus sp. BBL2006]